MNLRLPLLAAAVLASLNLAGCATNQGAHTREMLSSAGFFEITPETERQKQLYAEAPSYQMHSINAKGKTFYVYKDEKRGTAMVGDAIKFRQYQRLLMEESAQEKVSEAVIMSPYTSMGWYGAYGPMLYGPRYGTLRYYR